LAAAAANGHTAMVELLLEAGADVNARDEDGWTALRMAINEEWHDIANLLIQYGATE
jgi:ankyrin repeat protein